MKYENYCYIKLNKAELLEVSKSDFSSIKCDTVSLVSIIMNYTCDNEVLEALLKNESASLDKLKNDHADRILHGLASVVIKDITLLLLAIKRLKNNKYFMLGIKSNEFCYGTFLKKQEQAVELFNNTLTEQVEKLNHANKLDSISSINKELQLKREELLEQYPEAQLLSISEVINKVKATEAAAAERRRQQQAKQECQRRLEREAAESERQRQQQEAATQQQAVPYVPIARRLNI